MSQARRNVFLQRLLVWGGLALAWEIIAILSGSSFLPRLSDILRQMPLAIVNGDLLTIVDSVRQMLIGFGIASVVGIPLGLLMGSSRRVDALLGIYVRALFVIPLEAVVPLLIVLVGTQFVFRVAAVFLYSIFYITINAAAAVQAVSPRLQEMATAFGASRLDKLRFVVLPSALPYVFSGLRLGLGNAFKGMIIAELWIVVGTGAKLVDLTINFQWTEFFSLVFYIVILGALSSQILLKLQKRIASWGPVASESTWQEIQPKRGKFTVLSLFSMAVLLVIWQWVGSRPGSFSIAPPTSVFMDLSQAIVSGELLKAAAGTLLTMFLGYGIAVLLGICLGCLIALSDFAKNTLEPLVNVAHAAPLSLFIPLIAALIGFGLEARITLIVLWCVFAVIFNTITGIREVTPEFHEMAKSFRASRWAEFRKVTLPAALPHIKIGLRLALGSALRGALAAETLLAVSDLGKFIKHAGATFQMTRLLAGILFVASLGLLLMWLAQTIEKILLGARRI